MTQYNENETNDDVRRVSGEIASRLEGQHFAQWK
jgi:hypothetical protein